ncbi:hypothetical protein LFL96_04920 [Paraburkholderia sp. D15]|uniref:hypothetical protein n=1 Tax=Paraburkholderia sp. D15 TaxID=2880218 RepID=UPI0024791199|nr:hypothetical protein [Paraburkholderia sp. D15]WGS50848.1 hypothetical protein LFL96_04920 [Paraburkholderia sp. D15]
MLVVALGFVLSTILGTWITHRLDQQQKEREAITRSHDAVRAATDDLTVSLAQYQMRTMHLLDQIVAPARTSRFDEAARDYETAYANWVERSSADRAIIEQFYQSTPVIDDVRNYFWGFEKVSNAVDGCLRLYLAMPGLRDDIEHADITCHSLQTTFVLSKQMYELHFCVRGFLVTARPDPNRDFVERDAENVSLQSRMAFFKPLCREDKTGLLHETP